MAAKGTILVTGAKGQLASEFDALAPSFPQYNFLFVSREELPVQDAEAVSSYFKKHTIDYCINCAAYTAVDKAETETEAAYMVNSTAAGILAEACKVHHSLLIHFSTDYVFDGKGTVPYKETDITAPVGIYGKSKLQGEQLILQHNAAAIIIRTSWVFSQFGNNFVKTMVRLMREKKELNVVSDQVGCPTYAADLATAVMKIISQPGVKASIPAIFNYCNEGVTNWYEFALAIKAATGSNCTVNPVPSSQYPTAAIRPDYSVLDTTRIREAFQLDIPTWRESLLKCIFKLKDIN